MSRSTLATLVVLALGAASPARAAGPFGFEMGMTRAQLKARGLTLRPMEQPLVFRTDRAPKSHPAFEGYLLRIDPKLGLTAVTAIGKDLKTGPTGAAVRKQFRLLQATLAARYGPPRTYDGLQGDSRFTEPEEWMAGLVADERALAAFWGLDPDPDDPPLADHIVRISLVAGADRAEAGFLKLTYEFENTDAPEATSDDGGVTL
jgi:hypothetical protein